MRRNFLQLKDSVELIGLFSGVGRGGGVAGGLNTKCARSFMLRGKNVSLGAEWIYIYIYVVYTSKYMYICFDVFNFRV